MNLPTALARAGPWLVALAPAWFVYDTLINIYHVLLIFAILIAAGVELTGVSTFYTFTRLYSWNRSRRKTDPGAPVWIAVLLIGGYVISGVILTAVIKSDWRLGLFFLLAVVGYASISLNIDQDQREKAKAQAKQERRQRQAERPAERPADEPQPPERSPEMDELLQTIIERSAKAEFGQAEIQAWTGRQRTTAYAVLSYGKQLGVIEHVRRGVYVCRNGGGPDEE